MQSASRMKRQFVSIVAVLLVGSAGLVGCSSSQTQESSDLVGDELPIMTESAYTDEVPAGEGESAPVEGASSEMELPSDSLAMGSDPMSGDPLAAGSDSPGGEAGLGGESSLGALSESSLGTEPPAGITPPTESASAADTGFGTAFTTPEEPKKPKPVAENKKAKKRAVSNTPKVAKREAPAPAPVEPAPVDQSGPVETMSAPAPQDMQVEMSPPTPVQDMNAQVSPPAPDMSAQVPPPPAQDMTAAMEQAQEPVHYPPCAAGTTPEVVGEEEEDNTMKYVIGASALAMIAAWGFLQFRARRNRFE